MELHHRLFKCWGEHHYNKGDREIKPAPTTNTETVGTSGPSGPVDESTTEEDISEKEEEEEGEEEEEEEEDKTCLDTTLDQDEEEEDSDEEVEICLFTTTTQDGETKEVDNETTYSDSETGDTLFLISNHEANDKEDKE
jgi:hypothetical protein